MQSIMNEDQQRPVETRDSEVVDTDFKQYLLLFFK